MGGLGSYDAGAPNFLIGGDSSSERSTGRTQTLPQLAITPEHLNPRWACNAVHRVVSWLSLLLVPRRSNVFGHELGVGIVDVGERIISNRVGSEHRPVCRTCARNGEDCEWGVKLVFRPEHIETISASHPSMQRKTTEPQCPKDLRIIDVTPEVIRDYWNDAPSTPESNVAASPTEAREVQHHKTTNARDDLCTPLVSGTVRRADVEAHNGLGDGTVGGIILQESPDPQIHSPARVYQNLRNELMSAPSPCSYDTMQSAAARLLNLGRSNSTTVDVEAQYTRTLPDSTVLLPGMSSVSNSSSPASHISPEDGVFVPGSAYFEFHSALRNHTFQAARSAFPTRPGSPEDPFTPSSQIYAVQHFHVHDTTSNATCSSEAARLSVPTSQFTDLTQQEEHLLWKNWVDEIAPWLDKFDNEHHFGHALPPLAREHLHLRFSMLALSARQLERKYPERSLKSLELYQEAIHLLVPQLQERTTAVVVSCVVLCVLEMMSCSPEMWRQHLDGCASLIQSLDIDGLSGGLKQALFWCFIRMDLCGAFISNERTIIPIESWLPEPAAEPHITLFYRSMGFNMYANYMVYLCGRVMDLITKKSEGYEYARRWSELFCNITECSSLFEFLSHLRESAVSHCFRFDVATEASWSEFEARNQINILARSQDLRDLHFKHAPRMLDELCTTTVDRGKDNVAPF
ncbi:uncharacterized protein JN550_005341 [Neoarthrinium moseri]|uniref:uncharacterized protein n=1 Tax=Neoarthrinium moseri TaxID=1658444 RepID=UPI001FDD0303|nr:uncharacterized protein JN550_005341 [Neoarthrinium moseri]KAI1870413.1 hypothetical protein JN550_005341 [Neoarthrinium moseri]